ncbi:hypothetical protein BVH03_16730 [Pseudomonas sp. PA15(2017)]|uniref:hypothetical protein n=1 Tax=Pseudomonas sp. PA15(2017) TaxID=1932111 RepID=UPI000966E420|nr:hypothetical protein [Pseudomonas sp. PA15(2017)]OLU26352.1 hypothetical protein BVH03_16730 [Pseudomonas sp. PA15(2017)]
MEQSLRPGLSLSNGDLSIQLLDQPDRMGAGGYDGSLAHLANRASPLQGSGAAQRQLTPTESDFLGSLNRFWSSHAYRHPR